MLAVVAAAGNHRWHSALQAGAGPPAYVPLATVAVQQTASARAAVVVRQLHPPGWISVVLVALLVAAALVVVALVVRALWPVVRDLLRRRVPPPPPGPLGVEDLGLDGFADRLRAGVDAAETGLAEAGGTSSDAVIACWLRLEEAAARTGTVRAAWQTPSEFTSALLVAHDADPAACAELLDLYQRARFGHEHLGPVDTGAAAGALRRIARTVGGSGAERTSAASETGR